MNLNRWKIFGFLKGKKAAAMIFAVFLLLALPLSAGATVIGTAQLTLDYSSPTGWASFPNGESGNFYLDYDAKVSYSGTSFWSEAFCVEYMDGPPEWSTQSYTLLAIDNDLSSHFGGDTTYVDRFFAAAWIAENYYDVSDTVKAAAQIAVWEVMFDYSDTGDYDLADGLFQSNAYTSTANDILIALGNAAGQLTGTTNWVLAVNPVLDSDGQVDLAQYQNYLVKNPAPVPEPATLMMMGIGLLGVGLVTRRKIQK